VCLGGEWEWGIFFLRVFEETNENGVEVWALKRSDPEAHHSHPFLLKKTKEVLLITQSYSQFSNEKKHVTNP
jgi:hypothetical protein